MQKYKTYVFCSGAHSWQTLPLWLVAQELTPDSNSFSKYCNLSGVCSWANHSFPWYMNKWFETCQEESPEHLTRLAKVVRSVLLSKTHKSYTFALATYTLSGVSSWTKLQETILKQTLFKQTLQSVRSVLLMNGECGPNAEAVRSLLLIKTHQCGIFVLI